MNQHVEALFHGVAVGFLTVGLLGAAVYTDLSVPMTLIGIAIGIEIIVNMLKEGSDE